MGKRKMVTVTANTFSPYDFEGTLENLLKDVKQLIRTYGSKARLDYDPHHYEPYSTEASPQFGILVSREETEEEYQSRVAVEKALGDDREARERAEFERLSKKFGAV
jgi:uncharacterized protein YwgA